MSWHSARCFLPPQPNEMLFSAAICNSYSVLKGKYTTAIGFEHFQLFCLCMAFSMVLFTLVPEQWDQVIHALQEQGTTSYFVWMGQRQRLKLGLSPKSLFLKSPSVTLSHTFNGGCPAETTRCGFIEWMDNKMTDEVQCC